MASATIKLTSKLSGHSYTVVIEAFKTEPTGGWLLLEHQIPPILDLGEPGGGWFWSAVDHTLKLYAPEADWIVSMEGVTDRFLSLFCQKAVRGEGVKRRLPSAAIERITWEIFDPCV